MIAAAALMMPALDSAHARGGGGHMGGGRMGGGWSGGRGGGGFEHGGGEFRGGGDRPGEHGSGERHDGDQGKHNRDNNNNNNNTNNYYGGGGWGWGAADDALAGIAVGAAIANSSQPSTVIIEQPQAPASQQMVTGAPAYGTDVTTLPSGAVSRNIHGTMAYEANNVWYRPYFGSNGVYYEVVSPPPAEDSVSSQ